MKSIDALSTWLKLDKYWLILVLVMPLKKQWDGNIDGGDFQPKEKNKAYIKCVNCQMILLVVIII